jgi:hypothetical protein
MPYRRIVGMEVGDEGSRFAMLASFVSQPTNKELCAKVGDGMRGKSAYRRGVRSLYFSTQGVIRPDRHSRFPTLPPRTSCGPADRGLRNGTRALLERAVEAEEQGRMHRRGDREIN